MRSPAPIAALLLVQAVLLCGGPARADLPPTVPTRFDVNTFRPTPGPRDLIIIPQTQPLSHLSVALGSYFSFTFNPIGFVYSGSGAPNVITNQLEWDLMAAVGLYDWVEIGAILPVILFQAGSLQALDEESLVQATVLSDLTLVAKVPLIKRLSYAKGFGLALSLRADLPTGSQANYASDGTVDWLPSVLADYRFSWGGLIGAQVGAFFRPGSNIPNLTLGPGLVTSIGAEIPIVRRYGITVLGGATLGIPLDPPPTSFDQCSINGLAGLRWYSSLGITFTVGAGFSCHIIDNPLSFFLAAVWVPAKLREYAAIENFKKPPDDPDGDGVIGDKDRCPNEPGPVENYGCPIRDTDKDGFPDHDDDCPTIPGPYHGCPRVYASKNKIIIMEQVHFGTDVDVVLPESFPVLEDVAEIIHVHPEWQEILVEGHTDFRASDAYNLDLSQRRANSVMRFLISHGIEPSRLRAQGFGRSRPIATNQTEEGMHLNRRVEFTLLKIAPSTPAPTTAPAPAGSQRR